MACGAVAGFDRSVQVDGMTAFPLIGAGAFARCAGAHAPNPITASANKSFRIR
jgi:hypothetical protein